MIKKLMAWGKFFLPLILGHFWAIIFLIWSKGELLLSEIFEKISPPGGIHLRTALLYSESSDNIQRHDYSMGEFQNLT